MIYAILADIHANLAAFGAVLEDIEGKGGADVIWCLGDIVGYGPDPVECIELLNQYQHIAVAGNHDWGAIGRMDLKEFNPVAAAACRWTAQQLRSAEIKYLDNLPLKLEEDGFTLVHGSPREPLRDYLISISRAEQNISYFASQVCLVGHSHIPLIFSCEKDGVISSSQFLPGIALTLGKNRLIVNPGSVGQPRNNDPRASYAIYDSESKRIRRFQVEYDILLTQQRMMERNLPMRLIARLTYGV
jgi:predicted phosphodiesterase